MRASFLMNTDYIQLLKYKLVKITGYDKQIFNKFLHLQSIIISLAQIRSPFGTDKSGR